MHIVLYKYLHISTISENTVKYYTIINCKVIILFEEINFLKTKNCKYTSYMINLPPSKRFMQPLDRTIYLKQ